MDQEPQYSSSESMAMATHRVPFEFLLRTLSLTHSLDEIQRVVRSGVLERRRLHCDVVHEAVILSLFPLFIALINEADAHKAEEEERQKPDPAVYHHPNIILLVV